MWTVVATRMSIVIACAWLLCPAIAGAAEPSRPEVATVTIEGRRLQVRWESTYDDRGTEHPLVFEGPVDFAGITVKVPRSTDPDAFLDQAWGGQPSSTFDRHLLGESDHGEKWPAGRRYEWMHVYVPKGMPLVFFTPRKKP